MAAFVPTATHAPDPDESAIDAGVARAERPFELKPGDLLGVREKLWQDMWDDVGVLRDQAGLERGLTKIAKRAAELGQTGLADGDRAFNLTWHDWLNLDSLLSISEVITQAAIAREDSRGAHFREDFPETGDLESTSYTQVRKEGNGLSVEMIPVTFDIVQPGESLVDADGQPLQHNPQKWEPVLRKDYA